MLMVISGPGGCRVALLGVLGGKKRRRKQHIRHKAVDLFERLYPRNGPVLSESVDSAPQPADENKLIAHYSDKWTLSLGGASSTSAGHASVKSKQKAGRNDVKWTLSAASAARSAIIGRLLGTQQPTAAAERKALLDASAGGRCSPTVSVRVS